MQTMQPATKAPTCMVCGKRTRVCVCLSATESKAKCRASPRSSLQAIWTRSSPISIHYGRAASPGGIAQENARHFSTCNCAKPRQHRSRRRSGRELGGVFVAENANSLLELLDLERLLQDGHRAASQNPIEHFAVGITGDDDDRQFGIGFFRGVVNVVGGTIR